MLQKFLSKYGLATHLALLAAVPLALTPFLDAARLASVVFWLSGLAALWLLTEPSIRAGEHLSSARRRVRGALVRDPLFWLLLLVVLFALVRACNTGIALRYDSEQAAWLVGEAKLGGGPASVGLTGLLSFATALAVWVVVLGIRHGIGLMARIVFGVSGAFFAGVGGLSAAGCACAGMAPFAGWLRAGFAEAPFWASVFGVWLVLGIVCGVQAEARKWAFARLPFVLGMAGNVAALVFFAPPLVAVAWLALSVLVLVFSLAYLARASSGGAVARTFVLAVFGYALPVFLLMLFVSEPLRALKLNGLDPEIAQPEVYCAASEALSRIAREAWKAHPWFGVGSGALGLHVPFLAEKADWAFLPAQPAFAYNGYWTLLAERGIVGCLLPAVVLGLLLAAYCVRLVSSYSYLRYQDDADVFVFAVPPVAWFAPLTVVLLAVEAVWSPVFLTDNLFVAAPVALALAAAACPRAKKAPSVEGSAAQASSEN